MFFEDKGDKVTFSSVTCKQRTGWVVWRQRKGLSEHVAISVSYLGGSALVKQPTLSCSEPAEELRKLKIVVRWSQRSPSDKGLSDGLSDGPSVGSSDGLFSNWQVGWLVVPPQKCCLKNLNGVLLMRKLTTYNCWLGQSPTRDYSNTITPTPSPSPLRHSHRFLNKHIKNTYAK